MKTSLTGRSRLAVALERGTPPSAAEARRGRRWALVVPLGRELGRAGAGWAMARKKGEGGK